MKIKITSLFVCFFFFICFEISANKNFQENLIYPIKNYSLENYKAGTQNWCIEELADGSMCFANNEGLLVKNGDDWHTYNSKSTQTLRVVKENDGKIYTGGRFDFGYWKKNQSGEYIYTILSDKVSIDWQELWKIEFIGKKVYMQGVSAVFIFDTENDNLITEKRFSNIMFFDIIDNKILIQNNNTLYQYSTKLENEVTILNNDFLQQITLRDILIVNGTTYYITLSDGIFTVKNNLLVPITNSINNQLKEVQVYRAITTNNEIAIGTVLDGLYIFDMNFNFINHINKDSGLANNTILSLYSDHNSNLWVGYDNGIGQIKLNSNLFFYKFNHDIGTGYAFSKLEQYSYWGTNQGLYFTTSQNPSQASLINGTQGQVWCIKKIADKIYCGHHKGLFEIENNKAILKDSPEGVMNIIELTSDYYLVWCYQSLQLFIFKDNQLIKESEITSPIKISRDIKIDSNNKLWCAEGDSIYQFSVDINRRSIISHNRYKISNLIKLFRLNKELIVWANDTLLYRYDNVSNSFVDLKKIDLTGVAFEDILEFSYMLPKYVLEKYVLDNDNITYNNFINTKRYIANWNTQMLSQYEDKNFIINSNNGFLKLHITRKKDDSISKIKTTFSEIKMKNKSDNDYKWVNGNVLDFDNNNLRFRFSSNDTPIIEYQYKLEGYDKNYSMFSTKSSTEYTNLPEGNYKFIFIAKDENGVISSPTSFEFTIKPPFYRSNLAKILYSVLFFGIVFTFIYVIKRLLHKKERQESIKRKKEILELEKNHKIETLSKEKIIITVEKERLEASITYKQRELANSTRNIIMKNNLLMEVKQLLQSIYKEKNIQLRDSKLNTIFNLIDSNITNKNDWAIFESYFNEIHQFFFDKLKSEFTELSATDLKLCAYIRLNKSTKEIASLMNISIRGVETSRYRLRKKLNLDKNANLYIFLSDY